MIARSEFLPMDSCPPCPLNARVILMGASGVPVISTWSGKDTFWVGWAPIPKLSEAVAAKKKYHLTGVKKEELCE